MLKPAAVSQTPQHTRQSKALHSRGRAVRSTATEADLGGKNYVTTAGVQRPDYDFSQSIIHKNGQSFFFFLSFALTKTCG